MTRVDRSALVLHTDEQMYALVNDVLSYPQFLPWCSSASIIKQSDDEMVARVDVSKAGFKYSFTTCNRLESPGKIHMELVDGPFSSLAGCWTFTRLSEEACKVSLKLDFDFSGKLASIAMGKVFNQIAIAMVDAFCSQADKKYG